jgi:two-component system sensor histidine kinase KdpD
MQSVLQGRDVQLALPDNLPPIALDYLQIDQVVTNLLENAVRYTPAHSPIEIAAHAMDGQIEVSIADHGPGIPPYELERIFDKFYRVSGTARKNTSIMGTGLGWAVCRGLIEAHGGRIWAENRPEGGAIFRFTLPIGNGEGIRTDE